MGDVDTWGLEKTPTLVERKSRLVAEISIVSSLQEITRS